MSLIPLHLTLRGEREYIHGTDLYSAIHASILKFAAASTLNEIDLRIPRFFSSSLSLNISEKPLEEKTEWVCLAGNRKIVAQIHEENPSRPLARKPFDESIIQSASEIRGQEILFKKSCGFTEIEYVVFFNKLLHLRLFSPAKGQQWVFARLSLQESLLNIKIENLRLKLEANLDGFFTRSAIFEDKKKLGNIYFSKIPSPSF